jgi:hypothetical protein
MEPDKHQLESKDSPPPPPPYTTFRAYINDVRTNKVLFEGACKFHEFLKHNATAIHDEGHLDIQKKLAVYFVVLSNFKFISVEDRLACINVLESDFGVNSADLIYSECFQPKGYYASPVYAHLLFSAWDTVSIEKRNKIIQWLVEDNADYATIQQAIERQSSDFSISALGECLNLVFAINTEYDGNLTLYLVSRAMSLSSDHKRILLSVAIHKKNTQLAYYYLSNVSFGITPDMVSMYDKAKLFRYIISNDGDSNISLYSSQCLALTTTPPPPDTRFLIYENIIHAQFVVYERSKTHPNDPDIPILYKKIVAAFAAIKKNDIATASSLVSEINGLAYPIPQ